ncbi:MAG: hypothetical protein KDK70_06000, partial [Myxococcales bacterium]|nr:hypothetical protein [Myxococcales bacterium]
DEPVNGEPVADESAEPDAEPGTVPPAAGLPVIDESTLGGPTLDDGVLPCGLRVLVARDTTLPVAAVMLVVETGTEDDPPSQPGLVHALAYHLLQGNRELIPGGAAALVHDRGGITSITVGPAQVRFESLVPISALPDALWIESQRLRAPTVSEALWTNTLRWARADKSIRWQVPRAAAAAAHGVPGLAHDGREVPAELGQMLPRAIGQALAERFRYAHATLVVVSPHPPAELHDTIAELFAELPAVDRRRRDRTPRFRTGSVPQALPLAGESGSRFVWPLGPDLPSIDQASVLCRALNRQRRHPVEPSRVRVRCELDVDPRRSSMIVQVTSADDPVAVLRGRIERLQRGEEDALVESQREIELRDRIQQLRSALVMARYLAFTGPRPDDEPGWRTRPAAALTGVAELSVPHTGRAFGPRLELGAAIHLVPPEAPQ